MNYCGGGISATLGFFAQKALGYEDVALYDASMQEWGKDGKRLIRLWKKTDQNPTKGRQLCFSIRSKSG